MNRRMRTYFYAVFGAIGGLIGWQMSNFLGLSFIKSLYLSEAIVGALVGCVIGLFIGITEGLLTQNFVQTIKAGLFSAFLGLVAGAIGLPLSEFLFQAVGAGILGRILGWAVFGLLLGLAKARLGKVCSVV
jgi:hypothetical protein